MSAAERALAEALDWLGTPYRHQASRKGVGCDCIGLVRGVWRALYGCEPETIGAYAPDWAEATGEERLLDAASRHCLALPTAEAGPGDLILFRWRPQLPAKHAGILAAGGRFVHAYEGHAVALSPLASQWRRRIAGCFAFPPIEKDR